MFVLASALKETQTSEVPEMGTRDSERKLIGDSNRSTGQVLGVQSYSSPKIAP